jgi:trigger factor
VCGAPIIDYHHIIPYGEKEHHEPEHMVALCPNHHRPADDGAIPRTELYEAKNNPANSKEVDYIFHYDAKSPVIELGSCSMAFGRTGKCTLLKIENTEIISAEYDGKILQLNISFYDKSGNLIAEISDNEWWADVREIWDMKYKSKWFKLWNGDEEVGLKVEYDEDSNHIKLKGKFYYDGAEFYIHPSKIWEPDTDGIVADMGLIMGGEEGVDEEIRSDYPDFPVDGFHYAPDFGEEMDGTLFHLTSEENRDTSGNTAMIFPRE